MGNHLTKKKIGLLGGTFDPFHFGHLNLAIEMKEKQGLDQVWFCPARLSPFKLQEQATDGQHRLKMIQLAIEGLPFFQALDLELLREGPSYTIDTILELQRREGEGVQFYLILG